MPFKTFAALDVLTAADVNDYLMEQTVIVCTSGTRPASPNEGMVVYETDTKRLAKYTGSAWEYFAGSRVAYAPTLSATTTPPTMGTGNKVTGWYIYQPGPSILFSFFIKFGTSGAAAGSGQYTITLPVTAANAHSGDQPAMGSAMLRDDSAGSIQAGSVYVPGSNLAVCSIVYAAGGGIVSNSVPWTWANLDYLAGTIQYPI